MSHVVVWAGAVLKCGRDGARGEGLRGGGSFGGKKFFNHSFSVPEHLVVAILRSPASRVPSSSRGNRYPYAREIFFLRD